MDTFDPIDDLWLQKAKKRYASAVIGAPGACRSDDAFPFHCILWAYDQGIL